MIANAVSDLLANNSALPTLHVPGDNQKMVDDLILQYAFAPVSDYSASDITTLEGIANQCPLQALIDDTFKLENSGGVPAAEWSLAPNPTRSDVWLYGGDIAALQSIRLIDLTGRIRQIWAATSVMNGELRLNTAQLPSDIYYVQLVDSSGETSILKLSVIK